MVPNGVCFSGFLFYTFSYKSVHFAWEVLQNRLFGERVVSHAPQESFALSLYATHTGTTIGSFFKRRFNTPGATSARRIPIGRANDRRALAVCQSYLLDQPRSFVLFDWLILVNLAYMPNLDLLLFASFWFYPI